MNSVAIACEGGFFQSIKALYYRSDSSQGEEVAWRECVNDASGSVIGVMVVWSER